MNERAEDIWEPLLAVAEAAGGEWPARARQAALALTPADDDSADPPSLSASRHPPRLHRGQLTRGSEVRRARKALNEIEDAPWGGLRDGKGLKNAFQNAFSGSRSLRQMRLQPIARKASWMSSRRS